MKLSVEDCLRLRIQMLEDIWSHPNRDRANDQINMLRIAAGELRLVKTEMALGLAVELEQLAERAEAVLE